MLRKAPIDFWSACVAFIDCLLIIKIYSMQAIVDVWTVLLLLRVATMRDYL